MSSATLDKAWVPYALLLTTAASWGSNWVIARAMHEEFPPVALAFWRWAVAIVCMVPFAIPHLRRDWPIIRKGWRPLAILGTLGTTGFAVLGYFGTQHTTAINASLINGATPIFCLILGAAFLGIRIDARAIVATVLSMTGIAIIVTRGDPARIQALEINIGDLFVLAAMFAWAVYTVGLRWRPQGLHAVSFLFTTALAGLVACTPLYLWELSTDRTLVLQPATIASAVYLGTVGSLIGYFCWNAAVPRVGPHVAGLFSNVIPVFGMAFAMIFLAERLGAHHVAGIALVFTGIFLVSRRRA